jgi:putative peptidoglycan lipid II flippase
VTTTPPPEELGTGEDAAEPIPPPAARSSGKSAQLIGIGILLSRVSGLLRESIFARFFGAGMHADVFRAALRGPNVLQNLLGEGTLSASFIPVYTDLIARGRKEEAGKVAGAIFCLLVAVAGGLVLLGILIAPLFVSVFYAGFEGEKKELTIAATRIIFPMTGILALSAWALAILNSHRRFFLSYIAPVAWNAAIIGALLIFGRQTSDKADLVVITAWAAVFGGLLQFVVQVPTVLRLQREWKLGFNLSHPGVQTTLKNALPAISGRGVVQLSGWVDQALASFMLDGAIAVLGYAQNLYMLPVSLFGMSVAAAELPELSREREAGIDKLRKRLNAGLAQIAVLVVPSAIGYLLLGDIAVAALYEGGQFTRADTDVTSLILLGYAVGLLASTATRLFSTAFFALHDTRTPARIAYVRVAISASIGIAITVYGRYVDRSVLPFAPFGLALGGSLAAWIEWYLLRRSLHERLPGVGLGRALVVKLLIAAVGAGLVGLGIKYLVGDIQPLIRAVLVFGPYGVVYFVAVHMLGIEARIPFIGRFIKRRQ